MDAAPMAKARRPVPARRALLAAALALAAALPLLWPARAAAQERDAGSPELARLAEEQMRSLGTDSVDDLLDRLGGGLPPYAPTVTVRDVLGSLLRGKLPLSPSGLLRAMGRYLFSEVLANWGLLARLIIVAVLSGILFSLQAAFSREGVGRVGLAVCYLVLVAIALGSFGLALGTASRVVDDLVGLMGALLPTMVALLAASGSVATAGLFHPVLVFVVNAVSVAIKDAVIPLLFMGAMVEIGGGLSPAFRLSGLAALIRHVAIGILGVLFSVFLGVIAILGAAGGVADGVTLRTAKFMAGAFVPVVGRMFADAAELVLGSSLLLRNAVGVTGAVAVISVVVFPLLKILSLLLIFRVAAAAVQPVGAEGVAPVLGAMGNSLGLVLISVATVGIMFFLSITVLIGAGNAAVMLR